MKKFFSKFKHTLLNIQKIMIVNVKKTVIEQVFNIESVTVDLSVLRSIMGNEVNDIVVFFFLFNDNNERARGPRSQRKIN